MDGSVNVSCPACGAVNRLPADRLKDGPGCGKCGEKLFQGRPVVLTSGNFAKHVVKSSIPVVVDFWAPWCGPCKTMAPVFNQVAGDLEPFIRIAKLNTEDEGAIAARYAIKSIPTLILFKGGKEVARQSGAMDRGSLTGWIRTHI